MNRDRIAKVVEDLRQRYSLYDLPVDLNALINAIGVEIRLDNFTESLSGFAYQKSGSRLIGVNRNDSRLRQRFTVAHELGHLFLHKDNAVNYDTGGVMLFRDAHSSSGTDLREVEANSFAAELLMPEHDVRLEAAILGGIDLEDGRALSILASKYGVSRQAMTVRLTSLYFLR